MRNPKVGRSAAVSSKIVSLSSLAQLLSEPNLCRLAGARSYERGLDCAAAGQMARLACADDRIEASVSGTHRYRVELWRGDDGELAGACSEMSGPQADPPDAYR